MEKTLNIPGYRVKKELGVGGMGRVYLALETKLERPVALKVLSPAIVQENPRIRQRFIKEAKIAAKLHHSNIVSIYDVGNHEGIYYFAMEYLKENLENRMKQKPGIKPREALGIIKEVAKALSYAHQRGYVHRDIKPDNIMFRKDGAVVLVDFGIVKAVNEREKTKLTRTGMSIGTPQYMSPEQIKARKVDPRSDIYSLGIVLYEILTGHVPYNADDIVTLALKHTGDPVPSLPVRLKDFQPLIDKMLAKKPSDRVRTAEGLIRLIDALDFKLKTETANLHKKKTGASAPVKKRKILPFFILIVVIAIMIGSVYLIMESKKKEETVSWQQAQSTHTIASYREYLNNYPGGKYRTEALREIDVLIKDREYRRIYRLAREYFDQGKYEAASKKLSEAKKIKATPEVKLLEQKIKKAAAD